MPVSRSQELWRQCSVKEFAALNLLAPSTQFSNSLAGLHQFHANSATLQLAKPSQILSDSLNSVFLFARNRYYLSPARSLRFFWNKVTTNIHQQLEILRLMRLPGLADFLRTDPRFRYKFLFPDYLVQGLSTVERAAWCPASLQASP